MDLDTLFGRLLKKNTEDITPADEKLLSGVGIGGRLFFKYTKGGNTVVSYGYETGEGRFVVRFRSPEHPLYDTEMADTLRRKGFRVAEFLGTLPVCGNLSYCGTSIQYYDVAKWGGYDFGIRAKSAVCLLEKCRWSMDCDGALFASGILEKIGRMSGNFFGRMYTAGTLYLDFRNMHNLTGEADVCLFDIHSGFLQGTRNIKTYLAIGWAFFHYTDWYPENQEHKELVLSILKKAFVAGLGSSRTNAKFIGCIEKNIGEWG